jgi:hypothetical protein
MRAMRPSASSNATEFGPNTNAETELYKRHVFQVQLSLIESRSVTAPNLRKAANYVSQQDYQNVIVERSLGKWCGYPICGKSLAPTNPSSRKYRVSLSQRKIFDVRELSRFCSPSCASASSFYANQLSEEPILLRSGFDRASSIELWDAEQNSIVRER